VYARRDLAAAQRSPRQRAGAPGRCHRREVQAGAGHRTRRDGGRRPGHARAPRRAGRGQAPPAGGGRAARGGPSLPPPGAPRSEHVARVYDSGLLPTGEPSLVLEYLKGGDLRTLIKTKGQVSVENAVTYVLQACEALAEAHALGIVPRDLKPENLFLTQRSDGS